MEKMGDKLYARRLMTQADVPVIPGTLEEIQSPEMAQKWAEKLGYPVMIKAAAGGGGRGIRKVNGREEVEAAFLSAKAEAEAAFGDGRLYMEKCMENARHIEVQILCDLFGNAVHLYERECSLQRRNQKVMEEAPCIALTQEKREEIGRAAVRAAKAAEYQNAGTIEFLLDKDGNYYFMELNARIQVEHPVTEMATGIDLIKQQIFIADGTPLALRQEDIHLKGHAIECRINAEDPSAGFRPCCGKIEVVNVPGGPNVRFDSLIYSGYQVLPYFDSMIGKLIVMDETRDMAMAKMRAALTELVVEGIETNIDFQLDLLTNEKVMKGDLDTGLISRIMEE